MAALASLDGQNLPVVFRYKPYVPEKRNTIHKTHGAVVVQTAPAQLIHGADFIDWRCEALTPPEYKALADLYDTAVPTEYQFLGYWGEDLQVLFTVLDSPSVSSRWFSVTGKFQVVSVTNPGTFLC
jgi:hypothetical protein